MTFLQTSSGGSGPGIQWAPNQGVLVSFTLPAPQQPFGNNIIYGELHLQWPGGQGPAPIPSSTTRTGVGYCYGSPAACWRGAGSRDTFWPTAASELANRRLEDCLLPVSRFQAARGEEPEKRVASALTKMSAVLRNQMLARAPRPPGAVQAQALRQGTITQIQSLPQKPARRSGGDNFSPWQIPRRGNEISKPWTHWRRSIVK